MAFTPMSGIIALGEQLMAAAFRAGLGVELPLPFPRLTYAEAMARYGCDKPDTRYGMELRDLSAVVRAVPAAGGGGVGAAGLDSLILRALAPPPLAPSQRPPAAASRSSPTPWSAAVW